MRRLPAFLPNAVLAVSLLSISGLALRAAWVPDAAAQTLGPTGGGSAATAGRADIKNTRHNLGTGAPTRFFTAGNTSGTGPATPETVPQGASGDICVFCHTPHGANQAPGQPLWNRKLPGASATATTYAATYTAYTSSTLNAATTAGGDLNDANLNANLGQTSKLCLSCHDGMLGLGTLVNAPGPGAPTRSVVNNAGPVDAQGNETMPYGRNQTFATNAEHGFTRRLGTDLRNDHPISFTYNAGLASADGELRAPPSSGSTQIADRASNPRNNPAFPLEGGRVQCATCHEPHRNTQKFLRKNRLVQGTPTTPPAQSLWNDWVFSDASDQICMGCHTRLGKAWQQSAHADYTAANETYTPEGAAMRDFPSSPATAVWQAGCLNCHDTHAASGTRRLLREGVSATFVSPLNLGYTAQLRPGVAVAAGTNLNTTSALENTCFQCHSDGLLGRPTPVITPTAISGAQTAPSNSAGVPNIAAEFARTYRMPITNADQGAPGAGNSVEVHDVSDVNGTKTPAQLGAGTGGANWGNRHAECTDCHNPHRVLKANTFLGGAVASSGGFVSDVTRRTHTPANGTNGEFGNIAGGPLRGVWGVEPSYTQSTQTTVTSTSIWMHNEQPTFTVKIGDPGNAASLPVGTAGTNAVSYVTREYQVCFKCHSSYANGPAATDFPTLKAAGRGGTPTTASNGLARYTDVAKEFAVRAEDPPRSGLDQGEGTNASTLCVGGVDCVPAGTSWDTNTPLASTLNHRSWHPVIFPTGRNSQERGAGTGTAVFDNIRPPFNVEAKLGRQTMQCSDCHGNGASWGDGTGPLMNQVQGPHGSDSPFLLKGAWGTSTTLNDLTNNTTELCANCHLAKGSAQSGYNGGHDSGGNMGGARCVRCHIAVPHGWKNKAFLVNKRCVGREGAPTSAGPAYTTDCNAITNAFNSDLNWPPYYLNARLYFATWRRSRDAGYNNETSTCSGSGDMTGCPIP